MSENKLKSILDPFRNEIRASFNLSCETYYGDFREILDSIRNELIILEESGDWRNISINLGMPKIKGQPIHIEFNGDRKETDSEFFDRMYKMSVLSEGVVKINNKINNVS